MITTEHLSKTIGEMISGRFPKESEKVKEDLSFFVLEAIEDSLSDILDDVVALRLESIKNQYERNKI